MYNRRVSRATSPPSPWLFGPAPDLLFGCGLLYALGFCVFLGFGAEIRTAQPYLLFPLLVLALGVPHYGATLLRVYERRSERRAYAIFSVWATLVIVGLFLAALRLPWLASAMVTVYLTWSPWHYSGQNYGIAVMFLRRGGVALDPVTKRWLYASFWLSFLLVFVQMHTDTVRMNDVPIGYTSEKGAVFVPLGIPLRWAAAFALPLTVAYLAVLGVACFRLRQLAPWRSLFPALLLATSQLLWFSLPYAISMLGVSPGFDPLDWRFRTHYFTWVAVAHFLQYLWVTAYYARHSGSRGGHAGFYAKALLAGAAPWILPFLVVGPQALGPLSADTGLAFLVAAGVNIHHFVLDGAIWKLRGRIAEVLIRSGSDVETGARRGRFGLRYAVWAACAAALALYVGKLANEQIVRNGLAEGDLKAARAASERLASIGFDRGSYRLALGRALVNADRPAEAREQLVRSIELAPTGIAHLTLAKSFQAQRLWRRAAESYEAAIAEGLSPKDELGAFGLAGSAWLAAGEPDRALAVLERAESDDPRILGLMEQARRARAAAPS